METKDTTGDVDRPLPDALCVRWLVGKTGKIFRSKPTTNPLHGVCHEKHQQSNCLVQMGNSCLCRMPTSVGKRAVA
ncbi:hypothetical protein [Microcoleus sp. FACHB-831]|uniref:hypothetical protein n=1 Tax=Microcoleus sp. FACHB-831 TaxID=2692827 RepID=UPI0016866D1A|nr:hypothetical protein [Microcoleus sp. FACHB-831]